MTITDILVLVEPGATSERRLKYAMSMAASLGAKLTGLGVTIPPTAVAFAMMGDAQLYAAASDASDESTAAAKAQFQALTKGSTLNTCWREGNGIAAEVVAAEASCADLVVVGRNDGNNADSAFYTLPPADVVMTCGRPVLVLPDDAPETFSAKRILIGWKSTAEAARAVHDALPLLALADEVILVEIVPQHAAAIERYVVPAQAMAEHLAAHKVKATVQTIPGTGTEPGARLIQLAGENKCDLIVAGGYGHSRVREWVLGGVTRSLLHSVAVPSLLSH